MAILKGFIRILLLLSLIVLTFSYFQKNNLPNQDQMLNQLYQEPVQTEVRKQSFEMKKEEFTYQVNPLYEYEIYGLVVAEYDSENWLDYFHRYDPLNTKDLCVIWGDNIKTDIYQKMKFRHGEFTCFFSSKNKKDDTWVDYFDIYQISNSHILPKNEKIYKAVKQAKIGDQVYLKGYLVDYSIKKSGKDIGARTTSITREDTGNGACEVVYATDFKILKKNPSIYVLIYQISIYLIVICLVFLVVFFFIPINMNRERKY